MENVYRSEIRGATIYYRRYENNLISKKKHLMMCLRDFKIKSWPVLLANLKANDGAGKSVGDQISEKYEKIIDDIRKVSNQLSDFYKNKQNLILDKATSYAEQRERQIKEISEQLIANGWNDTVDEEKSGRILFLAPRYYKINDESNVPYIGSKKYIFYNNLSSAVDFLPELREKAKSAGLFILIKDNL